MERRRSTRLHPQIQAREEVAGVPSRRSPLLHPQIQPSEEGALAARRRSPRLHPQIHASQDGARRIRRRRGTSPPVEPASLPDNDDMLREILLRLPPQPSSLPRASAVCKRWRGLVTDPRFLRQFYTHHRKPPLLGFFERMLDPSYRVPPRIFFTPMLDPPDRVPPQRFNLGRCSRRSAYDLLDCHHGLVLVEDMKLTEVLVCDPITSEQRRVAIPPEFKKTCFLHGAVLCAAGDQGHVHGSCHSSSFKVVLMSTYITRDQPLARVYSSQTGGWGNVISTAAPCRLGGHDGRPATLVGNALYWYTSMNEILEFDMDGQSLAVITGPPAKYNYIHQIIQGENGGIGLAILYPLMFRTWQRNVNGQGVATWVPWKDIEMHTILGLPPSIERMPVRLLGYDEDDVVFLCYKGSVYMVQLKSMQSRKINEIHSTGNPYFPFKSFFTPGIAIAGGFNGAGVLHI